VSFGGNAGKTETGIAAPGAIIRASRMCVYRLDRHGSSHYRLSRYAQPSPAHDTYSYRAHPYRSATAYAPGVLGRRDKGARLPPVYVHNLIQRPMGRIIPDFQDDD